MIKHIQQQDDFTCGVACLAMIAEITFEEAKDVFKKVSLESTERGIYQRDMERALIFLGIEYDPLRFAEIRCQVPHIVTVPSLLTPGGMHYAVITFVDGAMTVMDPQRHREGRRYYALDRDDTDGIQLKGYCEVIRIWSNNKRSFL